MEPEPPKPFHAGLDLAGPSHLSKTHSQPPDSLVNDGSGGSVEYLSNLSATAQAAAFACTFLNTPSSSPPLPKRRSKKKEREKKKEGNSKF